ncbi:MAG: hypothetical protein SCABRO_03324 [Candidatus Scalindua brodae]|uniref:Chromosome partition protein Smc n=1 Tax=Candidatus Scalindua brodae TaxID=237368 RepID=A0A0B0ECR1_9BACT|nr:MAG: hypothetical protein SCABRO_03324 [Candidatus Scalindua brodae]
MNMRKSTFIIIIFVNLAIIAYETRLYSQPAEVQGMAIQRTEFLENAKNILESSGQDITNLESSLNTLKEELNTLKTRRDKLIEDKVEGDALDLVTKQKSIIENRINTLDGTIRAKLEMKGVAGALEKALETAAVLTDKKSKINEESDLVPASQFESIQKETELLKARLEAILAIVKEKEAYFLTSKTSLDTSKLKSEEEKKKTQ